MSVEANKALVRRLFDEVLNGGNRATAEELLLPERVDGLLDRLAYARSSRPDLHRVLHDMVAEGDKVAIRWSVTGTHTGRWTHPAIGPIAPTGKVVTNTGITIYRLADGKVAEAWEVSDMLGLLQQMEAIVPLLGARNE